jgi:DNA-binding transcriptional LysR family regulator
MKSNPLFANQLFNRVRLRQLALLLATQELRTLGAAAKKLGMTQPAASKMLKELEGSIGYPLFDRIGRGIQLNPMGQCVLSHAQNLQGNMTAMGRELDEIHHNNAGKLSIGSILAASSDLIVEAISHLRTLHPTLPIHIASGTSDHLMERLQAGELDLVIGRLVGLPVSEYEFRAIKNEALSVVVGNKHPLCRLKSLTFAHLLRFPWVLQSNGSPMRNVINDEFASHRASVPMGLIETDSVVITIHLIAKENYIAVMPQSIALLYAKHGLLTVLPYALTHQLTDYGSIVKRGRPLNKGAACFLNWLHD